MRRGRTRSRKGLREVKTLKGRRTTATRGNVVTIIQAFTSGALLPFSLGPLVRTVILSLRHLSNSLQDKGPSFFVVAGHTHLSSRDSESQSCSRKSDSTQ